MAARGLSDPLPFEDDYWYLNLLAASTPGTTVPASNNSTFGITHKCLPPAN